jgi:hypothetical protein
MNIIRPNAKPRLWWLFPWAYARTLHTASNALRALCDRLDDVNKLQADIIKEKEALLQQYREHIRYLEIEADTDHNRWLRALEEVQELRKKNSQS